MPETPDIANDLTANEDVSSPPFPERDPTVIPEDSASPPPLPDDGLDRPIDGSVMGAGDADPE